MKMQVGRFIPLLLLAVLVSMSCGDSADESDGGIAQEATERAEVLSRVSEGGSVLERRILEDGKVTDAEYEEAALALVACAKEDGLSVRMEPEEGDGGYKFSAPADSESTAIFEACHSTTYANVDIIHAIQNSMPDDVRERQAELVVDCLNRKGEAVESWPDTDGPIDAAIESECVDEATETLASEE